MFELFADITLAFILPFYIELKLAAIVWLVVGTKLVFDTIVNRELTKREKSIDRWLSKLLKIRDEIVAMIWFEISRCSIKIFTTLMTGGLYVTGKTPEQTPTCSDEDISKNYEEEDDEATVIMDTIET